MIYKFLLAFITTALLLSCSSETSKKGPIRVESAVDKEESPKNLYLKAKKYFESNDA